DGQRISYANVRVTELDNNSAINTIAGPDTRDRDAAFASLKANERFVQVLYLDALGRAGSKAEIDGWLGLLHGSGQQAVAGGIEKSFEARDRLLRSWYEHYLDRKSTRLNSSHVSISYAVFCLKKKTK